MDMTTRALLEEEEEKTSKWKILAIMFMAAFAVMIILVVLMGMAKLKFEGQAKELTMELDNVKASDISPGVDQIVRIDDLELDFWSIAREYDGTYKINMDKGDVSVYLNSIEDRDDIATRFMELYAISNVTGADND